MGKPAYDPFISPNNITITRRTVILKMAETVTRMTKIKLIKPIKNISAARGQEGQFLQAISHSCDMTKILQKLFFQSSFFESFINHSVILSANKLTGL